MNVWSPRETLLGDVQHDRSRKVLRTLPNSFVLFRPLCDTLEECVSFSGITNSKFRGLFRRIYGQFASRQRHPFPAESERHFAHVLAATGQQLGSSF